MGVDLKNEPHDNGGSGASWGTGNLARDWNKAAERAIASLSAVNTRQLFFVEGIGNYQSNCSDSSGFFWGENIMPARCYPLQLTASQSARTVLSPHVYGPDVFGMSYFSDPAFPNNMPAIWDAHFAASSGTGSATLTRVIGEWGGKYGNNGGNALDVTWQNAFVTYLKNKNICNTFYWSWNPNSGDTGGILQDDWQTPWSNKVTMLNNFYSSCQLPKVCAEDGKCR
jgi:endoglucanase